MQKRILVQLSVMLLLLSCGKSRFGVLAPELEPGEVDISLPTTETATVSNGFITIRFEFKGDMELESGEQPWNSEEVARFEEAGERWLEIFSSGHWHGQDAEPQSTMYTFCTCRFPAFSATSTSNVL